MEAKNIEDIASHLHNLPKDSIVFVDIDDTVIIPISKTFSSIIEDIKKNKDEYIDYEQIVSSLRLQRKVMLIDDNWPSFLSKLREKFVVYGLTKIDTGKFGNIESMEKWRHQELLSFGVEFSDDTELPEGNINGSSFYKGIFLSGKNSKSQTIAQYLQHLQMGTIVMIDDRQEHLDDIEQFCKQKSIEFIGILFVGANK